MADAGRRGPSALPVTAPATRPVKSTTSDLAVFGAAPAFAEPLHVGRPNIGDRDRFFARLSSALDRRVLTNGGPLVMEFEERIAELLGVKHALCVVNATIGLQIAAVALGLHDEVVMPSFSFVATAHALAWIGIRPVFCDVDPETGTLDPTQVERLLGPLTTGIVGVHLWGHPCQTERLEAIASTHGLRLMFDAAHAFTCARGSRLVGAFGDAEVFSFHATKFVNSFEGGAITTNDDEIAERVMELRNFGFLGWDQTAGPGVNGKMSEAAAAMGLTSLDALSDIVRVNQQDADLYEQHLAGIQGVRLITPDRRGPCNAQHIVVRIDERAASLSRDELQQLLTAENVLARRYFYPGIHRLEPYVSQAVRPLILPETEALAAEVLVLPTGPSVGESEIATVARIIRLAVENGAEIRRRSRSGLAVP